MDFRKFYKINPRVISRNDETRKKSLVENRRSRRLENFNEHRRNIAISLKEETEQENINLKEENEKRNRKDLLHKWKEQKIKEKKKREKMPFVVGIVRHNAGSPLFRDISNNCGKGQKKVDEKPTKKIKQETVQDKKEKNDKIFTFGKLKAAIQFKFKVNPSDKKLTVPITPAFMDPAKRGNLNDKFKYTRKRGAEPDKVSSCEPPQQNVGQQKQRIPVTRGARSKATEKAKPINKPNSANGEHSASVKAEKPSAKENVHMQTLTTTTLPTETIKTAISQFVFTPPTKVNPSKSNVTKSVARRPPRGSSKTNQAVVSSEKCANQHTDPVTEGKPYYDKLERETESILQHCEDWLKFSDNTNIPLDILDEIDSVVGQAKLLVRDKFEQFRSLVVRFETTGDPPVTADDLEGFWDMMYIQVVKIKERFESLTIQKSKNWVKDLKQNKARKNASKATTTTTTTTSTNAPKVIGKSRFREFMKRALKGSDGSSSNASPAKMKKTEEPSGTPSTTPMKDKLLQRVAQSGSTSRRRSSIASACCAMRSSLIGKTIGSSPLVQADSGLQLESKTSILKGRGSSAKLSIKTEVAVVGKKRVDFGTPEIIEPVEKNLNETFDGEDIDFHKADLNGTFEVINSPVHNAENTTQMEETASRQKIPKAASKSALEDAISDPIWGVPMESDSAEESDSTDGKIMRFNIKMDTPKLMRKSSRISANTPALTPRRSARLTRLTKKVELT